MGTLVDRGTALNETPFLQSFKYKIVGFRIQAEGNMVGASAESLRHGFVILSTEEHEQRLIHPKHGLRSILSAAYKAKAEHLAVERDGALKVGDAQANVVVGDHGRMIVGTREKAQVAKRPEKSNRLYLANSEQTAERSPYRIS